MELDELKYQLNNRLSTDHARSSEKDFAALLNKKTISLTDKLKKSLRKEIITGIIVIIGFGLVAIFGTRYSFRIYFGVFSFVCLGLLFVKLYLLRRLNFLTISTVQPVKANLQTIVRIIEEFVRRYFQFSMWLLPICFVFAFYLGYTEKQSAPRLSPAAKHLSPSLIITMSLAYMALLGVGAYYFTKWYLKKLYGKYISQLKECIRELEGE